MSEDKYLCTVTLDQILNFWKKHPEVKRFCLLGVGFDDLRSLGWKFDIRVEYLDSETKGYGLSTEGDRGGQNLFWEKELNSPLTEEEFLRDLQG